MSNGNGQGAPAQLEATADRVARRFNHDGQEWLAWPSGHSAYGTGTIGPASVEAVHFARAEKPDEPAFEALLPSGTFFGLYDEELVVLLARSTKVVDASERPLKPATRRGEGLF